MVNMKKNKKKEELKVVEETYEEAPVLLDPTMSMEGKNIEVTELTPIEPIVKEELPESETEEEVQPQPEEQEDIKLDGDFTVTEEHKEEVIESENTEQPNEEKPTESVDDGFTVTEEHKEEVIESEQENENEPVIENEVIDPMFSQDHPYKAPILDKTPDSYIFSKHFYKSDLTKCGLMERLVHQYLNNETIADEDLFTAVTQYHMWTTEEQYNLIPILLFLIKYHINTLDKG